jgi:hypothetical protein
MAVRSCRSGSCHRIDFGSRPRQFPATPTVPRMVPVAGYFRFPYRMAS